MRALPLLLFLLVLTPSLSKDPNLELISLEYQWSYFENFSIFTFKPLEDLVDDNEFKTALVESGSNNREVFFSFCNDSEITCSNPIDDPGSALIRDKDSQVCTRITSPSWEDATVTYVKNDLDRTRDHLRLSWEGRDPCPADATRNLGFAIDLVCTDAETQDDVRFFYTGGLQDDSCQVRTAFESKLGCAIVSYREIAEWLSDNYIVFGAILIVLGFFLLFFGYRLILVALFLATVLVTVLAAGVIAFQVFLQKDTEQYVLWVILGVAFIIGWIVGYALIKFKKGGLFILAALAGLCIALILNSAVFRYAQSKALFWIVIGACSLGWGILSCFLGVIISIGATSLVGAYSLVRGISVFIGNFPDEVSLIEQIKNGTAPKTDVYFWGYAAGIIVAFLIGFFIQWRFRPDRRSQGIRGREEYFRL